MVIREILSVDRQLFVFINRLPHNFFLDTFFGFVTFLGYLGMIWVGISLYLYFKQKNKFKKLLATVVLAYILSLILGEWLLKNIIQRPRPQFDIAGTIVPFDFNRSFSFPSGHAVISFAAAYILGREHKKLKWFYYLLAIIISFSRIYLGKHYPSDVIGGALIGLFVGIFSHKISKLLNKSLTKKRK